MISIDFIHRVAEGKIQEAIDEGKFDDLPGKGKPIVLDEDPMTPPHLRMMNRILKNANVLPEWMQIQRDIETEARSIQEIKGRLIRENLRWALRFEKMTVNAATEQRYLDWRTNAREGYLRLLKGVNDSILKFTLVAPSTATTRSPFKIQSELQSFDEEIPAHRVSNSGKAR